MRSSQSLSWHACHASQRAISKPAHVSAHIKTRNRLMANEEAKPAGTVTNGNAAKTSLNVLAQYVKDLSFESPGAPNSLRGRDKAPGIAINVNVNANPISEKEFDVNLTLTAKASFEKDVLFNVELVYGGVFRIEGFPQ